MGAEKNVIYRDIGTVTYRRNQRARNVSIRISREGDVRVTVPGRCSFRTAEGFVHRKKKWIHNKLLQIERDKKDKRVWQSGDVIDILGNTIRLVDGTGNGFSVRREHRDYLVFLPADFDPDNVHQADALKQHILACGRQEAKERLPVLCATLAYGHGFNYAKVSVKAMKSRWGSCSPANNISLNSALIFLDRNLVEYVILHELVHTVHKHHGPAFWSALEEVLPGAATYRKALRSQKIIT
jgi:predicted metal-dependent hydrolase